MEQIKAIDVRYTTFIGKGNETNLKVISLLLFNRKVELNL